MTIYVRDTRTGYKVPLVQGDDAVAAHEAAANPHPTYLTQAEGDAAYSAIGHNHDGSYAAVGHDHDADYADIAHTHGINDLTDVTVSTPATDEVLKYNGSAWVNAAAPAGASALDDLTDVTITTPATNEVLTYNGSAWVNAAATGGGSVSYLVDLANRTLADKCVELGAVAVWELDEPAGYTFASEKVFGVRTLTHTNVTTGATALEPGSAGAASYAGTGYSDCNGAVLVTTAPVSVAFVYKNTYTTDQTILLDKKSTPTTYRTFIALNRDTGLSVGKICAFTADGAGVSTNLYTNAIATLNDGNPHLVVIALDNSAGTGKIWFDGAEQTVTGSVKVSNLCDNIGPRLGAAYNGTFGFRGTLDTVALFSKLLVQADVDQLYARFQSVSEAGVPTDDATAIIYAIALGG